MTHKLLSHCGYWLVSHVNMCKMYVLGRKPNQVYSEISKVYLQFHLLEPFLSFIEVDLLLEEELEELDFPEFLLFDDLEPLELEDLLLELFEKEPLLDEHEDDLFKDFFEVFDKL